MYVFVPGVFYHVNGTFSVNKQLGKLSLSSYVVMFNVFEIIFLCCFCCVSKLGCCQSIN